MSDRAEILADFARAQPAAEPFIARALAAADEAGSLAFRAAYASVARRLGSAGSNPPLTSPDVSDARRPHWTLTDWIRLALLERSLGGVAGARKAELVRELFESAELGEQESLLRTLAALSEAALFVETALLACRTNAQRVFEAIACDNAYPERFFPELGFNQMVLKAIFLEVPVVRIEGLERRNGPELGRMVRDYASERRAAGRSVPADVDLVLGGRSP